MPPTIGIAGGGIAGLTLAASLLAHAVDVVVFEREPELRAAGAGISLWPNALAAFDVAGLGDLVRSLGRPVAAGGQLTAGGSVALRFTRSRFEAALGEAMVVVDRGELVRALAALLPGGALRLGRAVTAYEQGPDGVTVVLADGERVEVDALVGADGIGSAVARQVGGPLATTYSGYTAWRGIAPARVDDEVWACLAGGHEVGWMPLPAGRTYWFATAWLPERHRPDGGDLAYLRRTFGAWPAPVPKLLAVTDRPVRTDVVDRASLRRWTDRRVTLVGDAAHPMRPHLGQGGCQAVEDAVALSAGLAGTADPAIAFGDYERRRRRRTRVVVSLSRRARLTRPAGPATTWLDRATERMPGIPLGPAVRAIAPIAGYAAGRRAVGG